MIAAHECIARKPLQSLIFALFILFVGCITSLVEVRSGELTWSPLAPSLNASVQVSYKPDSTWASAKNLYVFVYRFKEVSGEPSADAIQLFRGVDNVWRGEISVKPTDVFWMMKVYNGRRSDDNNGAFWETVITSDGIKPVQGAKLRAGIAYLGALPENCNRSADFQKALSLMREELQFYPNNISAQIAETSLSYELKILKSDEHQKRMEKILSMPFDTTRENDTRSIMRALNAVGRSQAANTLQQKFISKYPGSGMREEYLMWQMQNTANPQFFVDRIRDYHAFFPASTNLPTLQANAIPAFKEIGKLRQAASWLDSLQNPSAMAYNELAKFTLRFDTTEIESALKYAEKALALARANRILVRPPHITDVEWNANTTATLGDIYNSISTAYFELKRNDEALSTFYKALEATNGELPPQSYSQATMLLMLKKQFNEALRIASQGTIMAAGGDNVLMKWHQTAMDSVNGGTTATVVYTAERQRLVDSAATVNAYRQYVQRLERPLIPGKYFDVNKKTFEIDNLKGKVTLLMFMSTWAEPCQKMLPYINVLFQKYAQSGVVNFVMIDTWEDRSSDRFRLVRDFTNKNRSLYFPIFVDDNDQLAQKYGVMGVPMRLYIDKLGRIQYKATGFNDSAKLVQEIEDTLALLLSDKFYYFQ
jgi:thiol-disulfide isomerase/thioredoxin/tetratricopeptide (TPR) repeat protein